MGSDQICAHIFDLFHECCVEMFTDLRCSIARTESAIDNLDEAPLSDIDAGSEDLEIRVLLRFPYSVLAMTYPVEEVMDVDDAKLEDWLGEISNQLIGRLKNKLIKHEVYLKLGLPESLFGVAPEQIEPEGFVKEVFFFDIDNENIECHVLVDVINEHISFQTEESATDDTLDGGELELF